MPGFAAQLDKLGIRKKRSKDGYLLIARFSSRDTEIHWKTYTGASNVIFFSEKKVNFKKTISANSSKVLWILSWGILPIQAFMAPLN